MTQRLIKILLGLGIFAFMMIVPAPEAIGAQGWQVIAVLVLMLTWWISEAVPLPVTALVPIVFFPVLGIATPKALAPSYGHPVLFLFLGGFMMALAMQKWQLHQRIALGIIRMTGTSSRSIIAGFMMATAFLSMWMSNTATTVMMLPIALSVLDILGRKQEVLETQKPSYFPVALMIAIAFSANIGGTATLIGTPPNAIFAAFMSDQLGYEVSFARWMALALPFAAVTLAVCWYVLTTVLYPVKAERHDIASHIEELWQELGGMCRGERTVAIIFSFVVFLWIFKSWLPIPGVSDTGVAIFATLLLFIAPIGKGKCDFVLHWEDTRELPWGILLLFGGGLSVASAMQQTGLIQLIGSHIAPVSVYGMLMVLFVVAAVVLLMTEVMSNLALISIFLPVLLGVSEILEIEPLQLMIPATLAASCAFMFPMATPPNAIVFASGRIHFIQMVKAGIVMNLFAIVLITLLARYVVPALFL